MVAPMRMQFALALALVGCRGFTTSTEGHGSGAGPPGSVPADPGVPPGPDGNWCSVGTSRPGPYPVTVRYHNGGTTPVYLPDGCGPTFDVWSCDDLVDTVGPASVCSCPCDDLACASRCHACSTWSALPPGGVLELPWDGIKLLDQDTGTSTCHTRVPAAAGFYRLVVGVEDAPPGGAVEPRGRVISHNFVLPADGDTVDVELADLPHPPPPALAQMEPCTGNEPMSDPIVIVGVEVDGHVLKLKVRHLACRDHHYSLCYQDEWATSDPPQKSAALIHRTAGPCTDLVTRDLAFDLGPLIAESGRIAPASGFYLNIDRLSVVVGP
jgi:hypothetical protein